MKRTGLVIGLPLAMKAVVMHWLLLFDDRWSYQSSKMLTPFSLADVYVCIG